MSMARAVVRTDPGISPLENDQQILARCAEKLFEGELTCSSTQFPDWIVEQRRFKECFTKYCIDPQERSECLARVPLSVLVEKALRSCVAFQRLSQSGLRELARFSKLRIFKESQVVFSQGDYAESVFVVADGWVEIVASAKKEEGEGSEAELKVIATLGGGSLFGEKALDSDTRIRGAGARVGASNGQGSAILVEIDGDVYRSVTYTYSTSLTNARYYWLRTATLFGKLLKPLGLLHVSKLLVSETHLCGKGALPIYKQGDVANRLFVVRRGAVLLTRDVPVVSKIYIPSTDKTVARGHHEICSTSVVASVTTLGPGDIFGLEALFTHEMSRPGTASDTRPALIPGATGTKSALVSGTVPMVEPTHESCDSSNNLVSPSFVGPATVGCPFTTECSAGVRVTNAVALPDHGGAEIFCIHVKTMTEAFSQELIVELKKSCSALIESRLIPSVTAAKKSFQTSHTLTTLVSTQFGPRCQRRLSQNIDSIDALDPQARSMPVTVSEEYQRNLTRREANKARYLKYVGLDLEAQLGSQLLADKRREEELVFKHRSLLMNRANLGLSEVNIPQANQSGIL